MSKIGTWRDGEPTMYLEHSGRSSTDAHWKDLGEKGPSGLPSHEAQRYRTQGGRDWGSGEAARAKKEEPRR